MAGFGKTLHTGMYLFFSLLMQDHLAYNRRVFLGIWVPVHRVFALPAMRGCCILELALACPANGIFGENNRK